MVQENLIALLKKQIKLEEDSLRTLRAEMKNIDHIGIKALFEICAADSAKHASMAQLMLEHLEKSTLSRETFVSIWRQRHRGIETIKDHLERESQMIDLIKEELLITKDKVIKQLLKYMLNDETRHHDILKNKVFKI